MNSKKLCDLRETYMRIVEGQQKDVTPHGGAPHRGPIGLSGIGKDLNIGYKERIKERQKKQKNTQVEQVDIYDIILSHLLDEGYADTLKEAEAIMVNMSEGWKNSILEFL